ncbi:unnamed protein product [Closterium sp. Naga37s-1]|nr:unnamed protein product [Closterium sp. Naga37s-1]
MHVWHHHYHTLSVHLPRETFPRGGYKGVPDGYVDRWPHAKSWPHLAKKKWKASDGAQGSGGIERFMTTKLTTVELRQAIAKLVVTCDLPFRIVEAEAFRELLILLNRNRAQKNFIPSHWTVSRDTVVSAAAALQSAIVEMLAKEGELGCKVSFTIDMWTAPNNKAWLVVTGHWIDENFQLRTIVLEFREMHGWHNASSNIAAFKRMLEEGGGQCFHNSRMHFRCLAHVINLAVKAALAANPAKPKPALKLVQDSTRWGSTHDMVERAGVLQNPITVFFAQTQGLSKADKKKVESMRLTDADWETLQAIKTFLSIFAKVSKAVEGAAYPTVAMVVPYYNGLIDAMESHLAKGPSATRKPMIEAALDDAHWEKLHPETDRRVRPRPASGEVVQLVRDRVAEYQARAAELAPRPTPLAPVTEEEEGDEADDDDDAQFLPIVADDLRRVSLEYWHTATNMQTLRHMVRDYLAIPATSASSERVFSLGRNLISWKRHRLASQRTRAVMILRSWYSSHPGQRIGEGRRSRGVAPPEFVIKGEGAEEDDDEDEEKVKEEEGVEADDTAGGEDGVVGSSSGAQA